MGAAGARAPVGVADLGIVLGRVPLGGGAEMCPGRAPLATAYG